MLGLDPRAGAGAGADSDNPLLQLFNQMMTSAGATPGGFPPPDMMGGLGANPSTAIPQQQATATAATPSVDTYATTWRLLHLALSVGLGLYLVLSAGSSNTGFTGSREDRDRAAVASADGIPDLLDGDVNGRRHFFFWAFATAEAVLITSRFFLDRARPSPSGLLWTVAGLLPSPYRAYAESVLRYGQIFSTVRSDLLVCVFILGVSTWLQSCSFCGLGGQ